MSDKLSLSDKMFVHNQVRQDTMGSTRQEVRKTNTAARGGGHDYETLKKANSFISKYYKEPKEEV